VKNIARHFILLRCPSCKERFQVDASSGDRYQCPHCKEWMEYRAYKPMPAEVKPVGPTENK
jgi:ribosomal protein L37AE/L43A